MTRTKTQNQLLGFTLFAVVVFSLLLVYRGWAMSGDEIFTYDSVESLVNRGDFYRTYEYNTISAPGRYRPINSDGTPWLRPLQEPMVFFTIAPLFQIGQALDTFGTMHVVWLFNIFVTALISLSIYCIALRWGYTPSSAFIVALLFGIGTNAVFYGRLLFREPVMSFFLLWAFAFAMEIQTAWREWKIPYVKVILLGLMFSGAFLTKAVAIFTLPMLFLVLLPPFEVIKAHKRFFLFMTLYLIAGLIGGIVLIESGILGTRYNFASVTSALSNFELSFVIESLLGYQISFGRSVWFYSPILLAGFIGAYLYWKQGKWRFVLPPVLTILIFSIWYGSSLRFDWLGGWGWGPRYMMPLLPILMLYLLPVIKQLTTRTRQVLFSGLALFSVGVQFLGVSVPLSNFYTDLFANGKIYDFDLAYTNPDLLEAEWGWMDQMWTWEWSQFRYHLDRIDFQNLDIAWYAANPSWLAPIIAFVGLTFSIGTAYWLLNRRLFSRSVALISGVIISSIILLSVGVGLHTLRDDPRYTAGYEDVVRLIDTLNTTVSSDSAMFVDRHLYTPVFMNYYKTSSLTVTLPYAPGESYSEDGPVIVTENLAEQVSSPVSYALDWSAQQYESLWFVASASPFDSTKIRPIERYLVENYFHVQEITESPQARAIEFLSVSVPIGEPAIRTNFVFDEQVMLTGYDLPLGDTYTAGAHLPISLVWETVNTPTFDYNVALFVIDSAGAVVAQRDNQPIATFGYMSRWEDSVQYRDNHAVQLPDNMPAGQYTLHVVVYNWQTQDRLNALDETGESVGEIVPLGMIDIQR